MTFDSNEFKQAAELLSQMGKPKIHHPADKTDNTCILMCACGKKHLQPLEHKTIQTPHIKGLDRTCNSCKKDLIGMCPIMCVGCREIIAYLPPGKDEDGFVRERGQIYHVKDCPSCNSEKYENKNACSILAEKAIYLNKHKGVPLSRWE